MYINFCVSSGNNRKKNIMKKKFLKKNKKNLLQNRLYCDEKKNVLQALQLYCKREGWKKMVVKLY